MNDSTPKVPPVSIPILMEPVAAEDGAGARPLGRENQQSLFTDIPPPAPAPERRRAAPPTQAERLRAARELLRARAPAIVEEVAAEHQKQLAGILRERLRRELATLLDDLAPADPAAGSPAEKDPR